MANDILNMDLLQIAAARERMAMGSDDTGKLWLDKEGLMHICEIFNKEPHVKISSHGESVVVGGLLQHFPLSDADFLIKNKSEIKAAINAIMSYVDNAPEYFYNLYVQALASNVANRPDIKQIIFEIFEDIRSKSHLVYIPKKYPSFRFNNFDDLVYLNEIGILRPLSTAEINQYSTPLSTPRSMMTMILLNLFYGNDKAEDVDAIVETLGMAWMRDAVVKYNKWSDSLLPSANRIGLLSQKSIDLLIYVSKKNKFLKKYIANVIFNDEKQSPSWDDSMWFGMTPSNVAKKLSSDIVSERSVRDLWRYRQGREIISRIPDRQMNTDIRTVLSDNLCIDKINSDDDLMSYRNAIEHVVLYDGGEHFKYSRYGWDKSIALLEKMFCQAVNMSYNAREFGDVFSGLYPFTDVFWNRFCIHHSDSDSNIKFLADGIEAGVLVGVCLEDAIRQTIFKNNWKMESDENIRLFAHTLVGIWGEISESNKNSDGDIIKGIQKHERVMDAVIDDAIYRTHHGESVLSEIFAIPFE